MKTIYPSLPGRWDVFGFRVGSSGLGNCFFAYFHAVVLAELHQGQLIAPSWRSIKLGPYLRGELSPRSYGPLFRPHPREISGMRKYAFLTAHWLGRKELETRSDRPIGEPKPRGLTVVEAPGGKFTFSGLHEKREMIRERLMMILAERPLQPLWGAADYAAVHVRLGDFLAADVAKVKSGTVEGLRIPLNWYASVMGRLHELRPKMPIRIFSDGREQELAQLLTTPGSVIQREPTDISDLLALSQARLLIGSNSTFSRWAAFLGNMPSIWFKTESLPERINDKRTLYVDENDLDAMTADFVCRI
jgi:hypothetical protein